MAPKPKPMPSAKGAPTRPKGGELDAATRVAFPSERSYAALAHSCTPEKRDMRQLLREAHKKGVKPEVLATIGRSPSASPAPKGTSGGGA